MPSINAIAGPNGAGKSTTAPALLRDELAIPTYLNADTIAAGLSAFDPDAAAFQAGRIMLTQLNKLRDAWRSFAFETTLATRSYAPWLTKCRQAGYVIHLLYLALPSEEFAIQRVALRVRSGGHNIPEGTVRRRFRRGLTNFFQLYRPICVAWIFVDNAEQHPKILARGGRDRTTISNDDFYERLEEQYGTP